MSHLPLDARAILEYLNELGYRNISAEQLKEFLKGMQPQSEISKSKQKAKSSSNQPPPPQQQQQQQQQLPTTTKPQRRPHLKIIKSKKPLQNYKFYLDICDHQLAKRIEEQIKLLGGSLEFFLTTSVTHFITDKTVLPPTVVNQNNNNNNNLSSSRPETPQTPATPGTPQTPYSLENASATTAGGSSKQQQSAPRTRQSRADAILNRARRQSTTTNVLTTTEEIPPTTEFATIVRRPISCNVSTYTTVWQTEQAFRFFNRIQTELKDYLTGSEQKLNGKSYGACKPTNLKDSFIKIESLKRNFRPYYQLFRKPTEWPKIELTRDDGAFRLSPKKGEEVFDKPEQKMTRKSRSRSSQRQQQPTTALPAAVQALKKGETGAKASSAAAAVQRNSNAGGGACKQVKESSEKQCGVCEICKIEYDTLTIHLKTKDHEYFAKNSQNFIALDTLIHNSADVNKFLDASNKLELKTDLEEMEVEEDLSVIDVDAPDPLEDPFVCLTTATITTCDEKRRSSGAHNTPSPTLREKSKRSTKGKHSSEKFQRASTTTTKPPSSTTAKSPKTPPKPSAAAAAISSQKKSQQMAPSFSPLDLQRTDTVASSTIAVTKPTPARRKTSTLSDHSPPIRAMLPPSSLYKVVETPEQLGTPTRGKMAREIAGEVAVGSPSLIVKFKKVRQAELHRLNGEAENFMFPKQRTSSEQPTDVDRQSTSDNVRVSISSMDSSSEMMDIEVENISDPSSQQQNNKSAKTVPPQCKKAIAIAKRRKGPTTSASSVAAVANSKQSFPIAPIQPEVQLKRLRKASTTAAAASASAIVAATASITLPEATRKSSRTATAIVTAATTSSRLLRAAVEAAKHNRRQLAAAHETLHLTTTKRKCSSLPMALSPPVRANVKCRGRAYSVVKMEDRMGDSESNTDESDNHEDDENDEGDDDENDEGDDDENDEGDDDVDDDDDDVDDEDSDNEQDDNDDYKDKDYKAYKSYTRCKATNSSHANPVSSTREQRAAVRQSRISDEEEVSDEEEEAEVEEKKIKKEKEVPPVLKIPESKCSATKLKTQQQFVYQQSPQKKSSPQRVFDYTKSERLDKLRYAFERLPASDLWYRVFARQDACEERYFEYFGSTKYRKLPYELGPIPFDRTLSGVCCTLCNKNSSTSQAMKSSNDANKIKKETATTTRIVQIKQEPESSNAEAPLLNTLNGRSGGGPIATSPTPSGNTLQSACSSQYTHKHKKLHLLQRYRQEQRELLQKQQQQDDPSIGQKQTIAASTEATATTATTTTTTMKCDSKASTPDRERNRERAGSTHSTVSSCASSSATLSKRPYRNKHLNKAAFLNLELPPRKSPREHASTLALVSCMIKQRQDSQSKPNSDTDEPPPTTPTPLESKPSISTASFNVVTKTPIQTSIDVGTTTAAVRSPRATRSAAATPIEELRFATEISENVKRLRRGQNKYDHSPPLVLNTTRRASRGRPPRTQSPLGRRSHLLSRRTLTPVTPQKRRKRKATAPAKHLSFGGGTTSTAAGSVRKTGSKKGVLEFEVDASALKALDTARQHTNVRQLEWEIDKYLQFAGKDYDVLDLELEVGGATEGVIVTESAALTCEMTSESISTTTPTTTSKLSALKVMEKPIMPSTVLNLNTPPPTDYFSSDFDLYDLLVNTHGGADTAEETNGKRKGFSIYSSVALHNYFRKRKTLKSNRTGWPKAQKKKSSARQQHMLAEKIRFLEGIGEANGGIPKRSAVPLNDDPVEDVKDVTSKVQIRESGDVITPPDSEVDEDENEDAKTTVADEDDEEEAESEPDVVENIPEDEEEEDEDDDDNDTIADSIDEEVHGADVAAEADVEEEEDDAGGGTELDDEDAEEEEDDEEEGDFEPEIKRSRLRSDAASPVEKPTSHNTLTPNTAAATATSTPSTQMMRGLRRTPQLNGSLGSCISPSEKAGDNSDIFTVSSDGLDTDLDMSNSHSQHKSAGVIGDDDHCANHTPKRKFDLGKYASSNAATSSSCAAEAAATAAVKSLAISQFLKKEVRVTCRRLRAPFRRFRYRR